MTNARKNIQWLRLRIRRRQGRGTAPSALGSGRRGAPRPRASFLAGLAFLLGVMCLPAQTEPRQFFNYVGQIGTDSVLLAWGTAEGPGNSIGLASTSHGEAEVRIDGRVLRSKKNWLQIRGLQADTEYPYEIWLRQEKIGEGLVRTFPHNSRQLAFLVIGDYGTGKQVQRRLAAAMLQEFSRRANSGNPVRFVLTTGDNIYGNRTLWGFRVRTGDQDQHWKSKFFQPYEQLLRRIPFYPSLGNHDGNTSESRDDLTTYLDNFFFPEVQPARFYKFSFGNLVEFFALDTTENTLEGPPAPAYSEDGPQFRWLRESLGKSTAAWKIPYFHHPPFAAGPRHEPMFEELQHFLRVFESNGVAVVFTGHEHNFQFSEQSRCTAGIRYVVTGAGGELRRGGVRKNMHAANIAGWSPQHHFLLVEIEGPTMTITPIGYKPIVVRDPEGNQLPVPLRITLTEGNTQD